MRNHTFCACLAVCLGLLQGSAYGQAGAPAAKPPVTGAASSTAPTAARDVLLRRIQMSVVDFGRNVALLKIPAALLAGAGADAHRADTTRTLRVRQGDVVVLGGAPFKIEFTPNDTLKLLANDSSGMSYTVPLLTLQAESGVPTLDPAVGEWAVTAGASLRETLGAWGAKANWSLVWLTGEQSDYQLMAAHVFHTDFKSAVRGLFDSLPGTVRLRAELRPDNSPPLVFVTRDEGVR